MAVSTLFRVTLLVGSTAFLIGCDDVNMPSFLQGSDSTEEPLAQSGATRLVERDIEAPEVFQNTETGLWDGRPSLGGVWVAHPDVTNPERVIIRNEATGKFVIGALFRRERETPGPRFQVSSDAAETLGLLAGAPARLNVTALRRAEEPAEDSSALPAPDAVEQTSLDPIAAAEAALDQAEGVTPGPATAAIAATAIAASGLSKPFIQIGIFSVESNAKSTAAKMRSAGLTASIKPGTSSGRKFWRVVVGPASSSSDRAALLRKIKGLGFGDAYFVTD